MFLILVKFRIIRSGLARCFADSLLYPQTSGAFFFGTCLGGNGWNDAGLLAALGDCVLDALDSLGYPKV